jgi:hypothetical protein
MLGGPDRHDDQVDVGVRGERAGVREGERYVVGGRRLVRAGLVGRGDRGHRELRQLGESGQVRGAGPAAGSDDPDFDHVSPLIFTDGYKTRGRPTGRIKR